MPLEYQIHYADKRVLRALQKLPKDALKKPDRELMALKSNGITQICGVGSKRTTVRV